MPDGAVIWSCPRCGAQNSPELPACARCGGAPGVFPVPAHKCPACGIEVLDPPIEGKIHCPRCRNEFEDYEEWVRRCRAAAWAATRIPPPPPEPPPPRPPHLPLIAGSLFAMAVLYGIAGAALLGGEVRIPAIALAVLQAVAGVALIAEWRRADAIVRLAAGLSALMPLYTATVVFFIGVFALFCRPLVAKYFGTRVDPAPDKVRHPLIAWLLVSVTVIEVLFAVTVPGIVRVARGWGDVLWGDRILGFIAANLSWAPAGVIGGVAVLALWAKVNRIGFVVVSVLTILGAASIGVPPVVEAWVYDKSARDAAATLGERDVQRLLWGVRDPDPKIRSASLMAMEEAGWTARVAVPAILEAFKDGDSRVRFSAACALAQFAPGTEGIVQVLMGALQNDRAAAREKDRAAVALGHLGPRGRPALALLLNRLRDGDAATIALSELGPGSIPGLTEALADPDAAVRRRAARALRMVGPSARSAVPTLTERLKDGDPGVRVEAVRALGEIHREKAVPALRSVAKDDRVAAHAAEEMLWILGEKDGLSGSPGASPSLNTRRNPAICEHLNRALLERDIEGSGLEILTTATELAGMCAEVSSEAAALPVMTAFRRIHSGSRKRSVLELLRLLEVDYVLEPGIIRVLSPEQAAAFWTGWLAESRKK